MPNYRISYIAFLLFSIKQTEDVLNSGASYLVTHKVNGINIFTVLAESVLTHTRYDLPK